MKLLVKFILIFNRIKTYLGWNLQKKIKEKTLIEKLQVSNKNYLI